MVHQGAGYALVPFVVGVQTVGVTTLKVLCVLVNHRVEAADCVEVDDGDCPDVARFFYGIDVFLQLDAALVGVVFRYLPVLLVAVELSAVNGRQQYNLFVGIHALNLV